MHLATSGFKSSQAKAVLKLALSLHTDAAGDASRTHMCLVLDGNYTSFGWPRCDINLAVPFSKPQETCSLGPFGMSFKFRNDNLTKAISAPCRSCEFGSCHGEGSLLDQKGLQ
eukprot:TRINITY_DN66298_c0_g1_i1.p1 TRINITY_DN66298_c0_g1~~TRINITY_DN66298_c0_g1_i1.p1  ORF type:complete len:120 (-),score=13.21 TRINITY_DN66298_c0_g1_i1:181-519(-)